MYLVLAFPPLLAANQGDVLLIINPTSGEQLGRVTVDDVSGDACLVRPMNASDAYNKLFWGRMLEVARTQEQVRTQAVGVLLS